MSTVAIKLWVCILTGVAVTLLAAIPSKAQDYVRNSGPELFSYDQLVGLGSDNLTPELVEKLNKITTTPFINNEAYFSGAKPRPLYITGLGSSLRVAFWNIERGLELDDIKLFLTDKERFLAKVEEERKKAKESGQRIRQVNLEIIPREIEILQSADVWILNEVDWGVKRTEYREVVREIAEALNMNWAYAVEFLEISPQQLGTETFEVVENKEERQELLEVFHVDKDRLLAMHGNAVLSRYPIRQAQVVPFSAGYDWFLESKIRLLEKGKRKAAVVVGEELLREVRRGQRTSLIVDLDVPELPGQRLTVVSTHLENRAKAGIRRKQMEELLNHIRNIQNPVVIGGDLNTLGGDGQPTSIENMLYKRYGSVDFWTTKGAKWATGVGMIYDVGRAMWKLSGIQYRVDPTSANLPGLSPNLERALFSTIEKFTFSDGKVFDFRGVPDRTINGTSGTLADSNQRGSRGFIPTFNAELIWGKVRVARFRLDWIFVKSNLLKSRDLKGSYQFAPHFARTLSSLNNCMPQPLSDHSPITVDLPFHEPQIKP